MWKLIKYTGCALLKYPAHIGIKLIRHDKFTAMVDSYYNISYGKHKLQKYDIHLRNVSSCDLTTVFYIHGGSWMSMDKKHYNYIMKTIAENGYRVVNINYRLMPKVGLHNVVEDCEIAINHAINNIKGINLDKLIIAGDSAGAHLAALIAGKANSGNYLRKINFIGAGLFYGLLDMKDMTEGKAGLFRFLTKYFKEEIGRDYLLYLDEFSPIKYFNSEFPPSFVASGVVDPLNPASMTFINALERTGVKYQALIFSRERRDGLHGFLSLTWLSSSKEALTGLINFFNDITRNS